MDTVTIMHVEVGAPHCDVHEAGHAHNRSKPLSIVKDTNDGRWRWCNPNAYKHSSAFVDTRSHPLPPTERPTTRSVLQFDRMTSLDTSRPDAHKLIRRRAGVGGRSTVIISVECSINSIDRPLFSSARQEYQYVLLYIRKCHAASPSPHSATANRSINAKIAFSPACTLSFYITAPVRLLCIYAPVRLLCIYDPRFHNINVL